MNRKEIAAAKLQAELQAEFEAANPRSQVRVTVTPGLTFPQFLAAQLAPVRAWLMSRDHH